MNKCIKGILSMILCAVIFAVPIKMYAQAMEEFHDPTTDLSKVFDKPEGGQFAILDVNNAWFNDSWSADIHKFFIEGKNTGEPSNFNSYITYYIGDGNTYINDFSFLTHFNKGDTTNNIYNYGYDFKVQVSKDNVTYHTLNVDFETSLITGTKLQDNEWFGSTCEYKLKDGVAIPTEMKYLKINFPTGLKTGGAAYIGNVKILHRYPYLSVSVADKVSSKSPLTITFNNEIAAITKEDFEILGSAGNIAVEGAVLKEEHKICELTLGNDFDYETEYTLKISESVKDIYGQALKNAQIKFVTEKKPSKVIIENYTQGNITNGSVACSASIKSNYNDANAEQDITMITLLFDNKKIIDFDYDYKTVAVNETGNFSTTVTAPQETGNYSIKTYVWDNLLDMNALCEILAE